MRLLFDERFLLLDFFLVVVTDAVTGADVADFVGEFALRLTIAESVCSHGDTSGFFFWRC